MRVDVELDLPAAQVCGLYVPAGVAVVAMRRKTTGICLACIHVLGDGEVAGHRTQPGAVDAHREEAAVRVGRLYLDAVRLDRYEVEAFVLLRPECIEVGGLRMSGELFGAHAGAAIEEHEPFATLELVHRPASLRRSRIAGVHLPVARACLVDDIRLEAHEPRLVDLGLVGERHRGKRDAPVLLPAEVIGALPV